VKNATIVHINPKFIPDTEVPVVHQRPSLTKRGQSKIAAIKQFLKTDGKAPDPLMKRGIDDDLGASLYELFPEGAT